MPTTKRAPRGRTVSSEREPLPVSPDPAAAPPASSEPPPEYTDRVRVPLDELVDSPFQHRRTYDGIEGLADSIRTQGLFQPIVVRSTHKPAPLFEVVFGHRRVRAARHAGLSYLDAVLVEMTDRQVVEAQVVENVQRADIHPIDEAEGYRLLHEVHGVSVAEISARVGRSASVVYGRMRLCGLSARVKKAALDGVLPTTHALLIARLVDHKLQETVLERLLEDVRRGDLMTVQALDELLHEEILVSLGEATFPLEDVSLDRKAGACSACPKRSGNQPLLFPEGSATDRCTDPPCFWRKTKVHGDRALELLAKDEGVTVLPASRAAKLFPKARRGFDDDVAYGSGFRDLEERVYLDNGKTTTLRAKLEKVGEVPVVIAQDPKGRVRTLVDSKKATALLAKAESKKRRSKDQDARADLDRRDRQRRQVDRVLGRTVGLRLLAMLQARAAGPTAKVILRRFVDDLVSWVPAQSPAELAALLEDRPHAARIGGADEMPRAAGPLKKRLADAVASMGVEDLAVLYLQLTTLPEVLRSTGTLTGSLLWQVAETIGLDPKGLAAEERKKLKDAPKGRKPAAAAAPEAEPEKPARGRKRRTVGKDAAAGEREDE
jgi:ParB/RepB/Spo0J family partition protein